MSDAEPKVIHACNPRRRKWMGLAVGLLIFVSGAVVGSGLTLRVLWVRVVDNVHNTDRFQERIVHRIQRRLDLTAEQTERVRDIVRSHQQRFSEIREELEPKIASEFQTVRDDIDAILTPEQSQEWTRWIETLQQTWLKPFIDAHEPKNSVRQ